MQPRHEGLRLQEYFKSRLGGNLLHYDCLQTGVYSRTSTYWDTDGKDLCPSRSVQWRKMEWTVHAERIVKINNTTIYSVNLTVNIALQTHYKLHREWVCKHDARFVRYQGISRPAEQLHTQCYVTSFLCLVICN